MPLPVTSREFTGHALDQRQTALTGLGQAAVQRENPRMGHAEGNSAASHQLLWPLFAGCWISYGVTLLLGAWPSRSEPGVLWEHMLYLLCTFVCSGPLWVFCHWLWRHNWSWPQATFATVVVCYPLGCASTLFANGIANHWWAKPEPVSKLLWGAFAATSPFCILVVWCGLYFGLKQYERNARVETLARRAELRALRHQLTPHFLCNTLNGISTLVGEGQTQEARRMIARLGDFLRATLEGVGALEVSLAQEIRYLEQYLAIEQARLGERLSVKIDAAPDVLDASVPNLLLQPLVENAVQHGVVPFPAGGDVTVRTERLQSRVRLTVRNQRRPSDPGGSSVEGLSNTMEGLAGLGLQNTFERLRVAYGAAASVVCRQEDARSWTTTIELPYHASTGEPGNPPPV